MILSTKICLIVWLIALKDDLGLQLITIVALKDDLGLKGIFVLGGR